MSIRYKNNLVRRIYKSYGVSTIYAREIYHVNKSYTEYFPGTWQFYYWLDDTNGIYHISSTKIDDNYSTVVKSIRHMPESGSYIDRLPRIDDSSIQTVVFDNVVKPYYTDWWFNECHATTYQNLHKLDLSQCNSVAYMFCEAEITSIDLSILDVSSVRFFNYMFRYSTLTSINTSGWNTGKGENFTGMFQDCPLTDTDVSNWDMSSAKTINYMFAGCSSLTSIDIHSWDVTNLTTAQQLFRDCTNLYLINLSDWTPINLVHADGMFYNCQTLNSLTMWAIDQTPKLVWIRDMFHWCKRLSTIDARFTVAVNLTNYTPQNCFFGCTNLATIYCNESWSSLSTVASDCEIFGECSSKLTGEGGNSWPDCGITVAAANTWGYFRTRVI